MLTPKEDEDDNNWDLFLRSVLTEFSDKNGSVGIGGFPWEFPWGIPSIIARGGLPCTFLL